MSARKRSRISRTECLSALAGFVTLTIAFSAIMDARYPHWTDREYAARRTLILQRVEEHPERPVLAVLGSSRTGTGFVPEEMGPLFDADGRQVAVFNYSHRGAGPRLNLIQLQRLLSDGIKPRWLLIELTTPFLASERMIFSDLSLGDVRAILSHADESRYVRQPLIYRLEAVNRYRQGALGEFAPAFVTGEQVRLRPYGGDDGWERPQNLSESRLRDLQETIRGQYQKVMAKWCVDPKLAEVVHDTLRLCLENNIQPAIVLFPESTTFRGWYGPGTEDRMQAFLQQVRDKFAIPVFDARTWMADDAFIDPHHLNEHGSVDFTRRMEQQIIEPWIRP
jgi:hypothetical protein